MRREGSHSSEGRNECYVAGHLNLNAEKNLISSGVPMSLR